MSTETSHLRTTSASTGTFDGITVGSQVNGAVIEMRDVTKRKADNLVADVVALAQTDTLTLTAKWQVSNDNSTWIDVANEPQNPSGVPFATGTAGADASVEKSFGSPECINAWRWARFAIVVGGTTGAVQDTWSVAYNYWPMR